MSPKPGRSLEQEIVFAAGGVVWRRGSRGSEVAIVHRPRHGDWSLPKGKLAAGERWQDAALREVREETGSDAELGEFAGVVAYEVGGRPKVVLFWNMIARGPVSFTPGEEVDQVLWLHPREARVKLQYDGERELLDRQPDPLAS